MKKFSKFISKCLSMQGFTLVEMLLYMGIFMITLIVFLQLFNNILATQLESQSTSSVSEDAKYLTQRIGYDISQAQNILSPSLGNTSSTLQFVTNGSVATYASSSGNLVLTNASGTNQLNSSDTTITSLSFTPVGSTSGKFTVEVALTIRSVTKTAGGNYETASIQTTVGNR